MPVNLSAPAKLAPVPGIRLGTASLGVRQEPRHDLCLLEISGRAAVAATFTRNAFCAAPVTVAREHLAVSPPRYLVINAGNANAGTGRAGYNAARKICARVAELGDCTPEQVLPFSTGVVGEALDTGPFAGALGSAFSALREAHWLEAAAAIITTDIVAKGISRRFRFAGHECSITGIAKGSGMIRPDMATMLAFIATDAAVDPRVLQQCLDEAVRNSFNCVSVDGDTSTNDACVLVATGACGAEALTAAAGEDYQNLTAALNAVCLHLAQAIVRDGEGASKFVTIEVRDGRSREECRQVAYTVAHSPLVKTALFASDANWGRILAAVGRSGLDDLKVGDIRIYLNDVLVAENGARASSYQEQAGSAVMAQEEFCIGIQLGRGNVSARIWTCDLSHDYVTINAEYRT